MSVSSVELVAIAQAAASRAYCPYSGFHVGAALLTEEGDVFSGCNVENVSFGLTNCAERTAVYAAVAAGRRRFRAIAIVQGATGGRPPGEEPCWPCGACRQVLAEFNPQLEVVFQGAEGPRTMSLAELLPHSFDAARLQAR
ncbi:MAG: cytidine deaminase [Candidatus Sericytochromatia bacterium]|nr:cytidine deaminase [Candidatus Sericytochromatia bacterium]